MWEPAYISSGFEERVVEGLRAAVQALPLGTAILEVGKPPGADKGLFPSFMILPANPQSARIQGAIIGGQGIDLLVGRGSASELWTGEDRKREATVCQQFLTICHVVFTTHFSEVIRRDKSGRVLCSSLILQINGSEFVLGTNVILSRLFSKTQEERYDYQPYY
jgi:hypothetical protein